MKHSFSFYSLCSMLCLGSCTSPVTQQQDERLLSFQKDFSNLIQIKNVPQARAIIVETMVYICFPIWGHGAVMPYLKTKVANWQGLLLVLW